MERFRVDRDISAAEDELLVEEVELLRDVQEAERQLEAGMGVPHSEARAQVMAALKR